MLLIIRSCRRGAATVVLHACGIQEEDVAGCHVLFFEMIDDRYLSRLASPSAACAAARRAIGTR